jgi:ABC-type transporter Mla subunit MlaD
MPNKEIKQRSVLDIRKMFVIALLFGILGVCLPQYYNLPLLAVLSSLTCMALYTGFGYLHSVDSPFLEQFADSVYYLGFLLTLVALVISLYFYQSDTLESGLLVANFSLALLTTIFGLAVRIYINNFQVDIHSAERHMMTEVEHAANDLVRKAKLISMQLDVSHQETQIAIQQSIKHAGEGMYQAALTVEKYGKIGSEALLKNLKETHETVAKAVLAFENSIQNTQLPEDFFSEKLNDPLDRLVNRLDDIQILLKELNTQQSTITQSTQGIAESMGKTVAEVDILTQSISCFNDKLNANTKINDDFVQVVKEVSLLSEKTAVVSENITQQTEQSTIAMHNFNKLAGVVNTLPDDMESMSHRLQNSSDKVSEVFQSIGDNMQSGVTIGADLQDIATALSNTKETVKQISDFGIHVLSTFNRLETFNQLIDQHTQLLTDMGGVAKQDINLAKEHQLEMAKILQQSRESLRLMQQSSVESINNVSGQMKD